MSKKYNSLKSYNWTLEEARAAYGGGNPASTSSYTTSENVAPQSGGVELWSPTKAYDWTLEEARAAHAGTSMSDYRTSGGGYQVGEHLRNWRKERERGNTYAGLFDSMDSTASTYESRWATSKDKAVNKQYAVDAAAAYSTIIANAEAYLAELPTYGYEKSVEQEYRESVEELIKEAQRRYDEANDRAVGYDDPARSKALEKEDSDAYDWKQYTDTVASYGDTNEAALEAMNKDIEETSAKIAELQKKGRYRNREHGAPILVYSEADRTALAELEAHREDLRGVRDQLQYQVKADAEDAWTAEWEAKYEKFPEATATAIDQEISSRQARINYLSKLENFDGDSAEATFREIRALETEVGQFTDLKSRLLAEEIERGVPQYAQRDIGEPAEGPQNMGDSPLRVNRSAADVEAWLASREAPTTKFGAWLRGVQEENIAASPGSIDPLASYMTETQLATFDYLRFEKGDAEAMEYYNLIVPQLEKARTKATQQGYANFAFAKPGWATATSVAMAPLKIAATASTLYDTVTGQPVNTDSGAYQMVHAQSAIRQTAPEAMNWTGDARIHGRDLDAYAYGTVTSLLDSTLNMYLGGSIGKAAGSNALAANLSAGLMSLEAFPDTIISEKNKGRSDTEAVTYGIIRSGVEFLSEKLAIESWLGKSGSKLAIAGAAMVAEGTEEVAALAANTILDIVAKDPEGVSAKYEQMLADGYTQQEALARAVSDVAGDAVLDFISGAASGGGMFVASSASGLLQDTLAEHNIQLAGYTNRDGAAYQISLSIRRQLLDIQAKQARGEEVTEAEVASLQNKYAELQEEMRKLTPAEKLAAESYLRAARSASKAQAKTDKALQRSLDAVTAEPATAAETATVEAAEPMAVAETVAQPAAPAHTAPITGALATAVEAGAPTGKQIGDILKDSASMAELGIPTTGLTNTEKRTAIKAKIIEMATTPQETESAANVEAESVTEKAPTAETKQSAPETAPRQGVLSYEAWREDPEIAPALIGVPEELAQQYYQGYVNMTSAALDRAGQFAYVDGAGYVGYGEFRGIMRQHAASRQTRVTEAQIAAAFDAAHAKSEQSGRHSETARRKGLDSTARWVNKHVFSKSAKIQVEVSYDAGRFVAPSGKVVKAEIRTLEDGSQVITMNGLALSTKDMLIRTLVHEVIHASVTVAEQSGASRKVLLDSIVDTAKKLAEQDKLPRDLAGKVKFMQAELNRISKVYTEQEIKTKGANADVAKWAPDSINVYEEYAADLLRDILHSRNLAGVFFSRKPSIGHAFLGTAIRARESYGEKVSEEDQELIDELDSLIKMVRDALKGDVAEIKKRAAERGQTETATGESNLENVSNSIESMFDAGGMVALQDTDSGQISFFLKEDMSPVDNVTVDHIKYKSGIGLLIDTAVQNKFITAAEATEQYEAAAKLFNMIIETQDPGMIWEFTGASLFSAVKTNADGQYTTTIDFTTVCRKTQDMITAMSKTMVELKRGLTKDEVTELQKRLLANDAQVPCPVCYVFSRWAGVGAVLDKMYYWQNKYENATAEELQARIKQLEGLTKKADLRRQLREDDTVYQDLAAEQEKLKQEKAKLNRALTAAKKRKNQDAETQRIQKENPAQIAALDAKLAAIKKQMKDIEDRGSAELAWLLKVRTADNYAAVPAEVLFDLDAGKTFASQYPVSWAYRTSRGPGVGKAILPYSDMRLGDGIIGPKAADETKDGTQKRDLFKDAAGKWTTDQQKAIDRAIIRTAAQNLIGGQRFQSTSDFRYEYALDYLMAFWEMQALGSNMQTYTKVVEFVDMVAAIGGDVNMSVMPKNAGYADGKLIFSNVTGMNIEAARRANALYDNAQMILVGINDQHIRLALEDSAETGGNEIGFVIPYHASGASIENFISQLVANLNEQFVKDNYTDYSDVQTDHSRKGATEEQARRGDIRKAILTGRVGNEAWTPSADDFLLMQGESVDISNRSFEELRDIEKRALAGEQAAIEEYLSWSAGILQDLYNRFNGSEVHLKSTQAASIMPHEYWNKSTTRANAYVNGFIFRSYCYSLGLSPRFTGIASNGKVVDHGDFSDSTGYWKTLIDRPMYRNDGTYRDQQRINVTKFDMGQNTAESDDPNFGMLHPKWAVERWGDKKQPEPDKAKAKQAARDFLDEVKHSIESDPVALDREYFAAIDRGDMETVQRMVDAAARRAGYTVEGYHGTDSAGFTVVANGYWLWFARDREVAQTYGNYFPSMNADPKAPHDANGVYSMAYRLGNNLRIDAGGYDWADLPVNPYDYPGVYADDETGEVATNAMAEWAEQNGYDSITFENVDDGGLTTVDVIFNPRRDAKSVNPITYDDNGNVIPLSERFNPENNDIRYSIESDYVPFDQRAVLKESTAEQFLRDYAAQSSPNYAQAYIAYIRPWQFLRLTTSVVGRITIEEESTPLDPERFGEASRQVPLQLTIDSTTGEVVGHEGRHRAVALGNAGILEVPVLLFDPNNKYTKEAISEITLSGQQFADSRSYDRATVRDLIPLNYANRETIISRFATPSRHQQIGERYGMSQTLRYSIEDDGANTSREARIDAALDELLRETSDLYSEEAATAEFAYDTLVSVNADVAEDPNRYTDTEHIRLTNEFFAISETPNITASEQLSQTEEFMQNYAEKYGVDATKSYLKYLQKLQKRIDNDLQRLDEVNLAWEMGHKREMREQKQADEAKAKQRVAEARKKGQDEVAKTRDEVNLAWEMGHKREMREQKRDSDAKTKRLVSAAKQQGRDAVKQTREAERATAAVKLEEARQKQINAATAWLIYHNKEMRQQKRDYEQKIRDVKAAMRAETREAVQRTRDVERAEAAIRLSRKDEQIKQLKQLKQRIERGKTRTKLQRNAAKAALKNKSLAEAKRNKVETEQGIVIPMRQNPAERTFRERLQTAGEALRTAGRTLYKVFVTSTAEVERFSKRQAGGNLAKTYNTVLGACGSTVEHIYRDGLVDRAGNFIGASMKETFLCLDKKGKKVDNEKQGLLQAYMLFMHNTDRMSLEERAEALVREYDAENPWLRELPAEELAALAALTEKEQQALGKTEAHNRAVKYTQLLENLAKTKNKPVLPDAEGNPLRSAASRAQAEKMAAENPWLVEKAESIYQWWDAFMREWIVGTSISEADYAQMQEMYPHYVPTYRADKQGLKSAGFYGLGGATPAQVVRRAKGSVLDIVNIEDSFANIIAKAVKVERMNELYQNIVDTLMLDDVDNPVFADMGYFDDESLTAGKTYLNETGAEVEAVPSGAEADVAVTGAELAGLQKVGDQFRISAWYEGELRSAYISEGLYDALMNATGAAEGKLMKGLIKAGNAVTGPMKTAITGINPNFALRNITRDLPTAITNSISGLAFPKYWAQAGLDMAAAGILNKKQLATVLAAVNVDTSKMEGSAARYESFKNLGGTHANYYNDNQGFAKSISKGNNIASKAVGAMGAFNEATEAMTRYAEYIATIDRMGDTYENRLRGIYNAAEVTVNFSRKGTAGKLINAWVPYWNPAVQGIDKVFRSVIESPDGSAWYKQTLKTVGRASMTTILFEAVLQVVLGALGRRDDWEKLTDRMKDTYYCIPLPGEHKFLRIPKNREWGAILGTPIMRLFEYANGRENPFENYLETSIKPNFLPPDFTDIIGISQYIDIATNKDFAGRSIVSYNYEQGSKAEQWDSDTSMLARWLSDLLGNKLGAMQIDYIIEDYFGDFGSLATQLMSPATYAQDPKETGKNLLEILKSPWVADSRYSTQTTSDYYERLEELEDVYNDIKNHGTEDEYKTSTEYLSYRAIERLYGDRIGALNKSVRDMPDGPDKDAAKEQIASLANEALLLDAAFQTGDFSNYAAAAIEWGADPSVISELLRLYAENGSTSVILGVPTATFTVGENETKSTVTLEGAALTAYSNERETIANAALAELVADPAYAELTEEEKLSTIDRIYSYATQIAKVNATDGAYIPDKWVTSTQEANASTGLPISTVAIWRTYAATEESVNKSADAKENLIARLYAAEEIPAEQRNALDNIVVSDIRIIVEGEERDYTSHENFVVSSMSESARTKYEKLPSDLRMDADDFQAVYDIYYDTTLSAIQKREKMVAYTGSADKADSIYSYLGSNFLDSTDVSNMPGAVGNELVRLSNSSVGYQYSLSVGDYDVSPSYKDPNSKSGGKSTREWVITPTQEAKYRSIRDDITANELQKLFSSSDYRDASDAEKCEMIEDVKEDIRYAAYDEFIDWLSANYESTPIK